MGYSGCWTAPRPSRIGVVQLGYADGYPWRLANRAEALVAGGASPVVGAVSMDLIASTSPAPAGTRRQRGPAGRQEGGEITAWELAELAGTMPYEMLSHFGLRLARRYVREGRVVETISRHLA